MTLSVYHRQLHDLAHDRSLDDTARIRSAIFADAAGNLGQIDPNRVRAILTNAGGNLDVWPRRVGLAYRDLARAGLIRPGPWTVSTDRRGHNAGKPARTYVYVDPGRPLTDKDLGMADRWATLL